MPSITSSNPARRRTQLVASLAVPLLAILAACGSSDGAQVASLSDSATPSATTTADSSTQRLAFAKCMRENGVDLADPDPSGSFSPPTNINLNDPKFAAAIQKCRELMPNGGPLNQSFDTASQDKILELVKCMRDHGVAIPDPQFDANGKIDINKMPPINPNDPKFASAIQACRQYLPSGIPGSGATP